MTTCRMAMAGLLVLAALLLFGVPSPARAGEGHHHAAHVVSITHAVAAPGAGMSAVHADPATHASPAVPAPPANPAVPATDGGCDRHGGKPGGGGSAPGCCFGAGCTLMHSGVAVAAASPAPPSAVSAVPMPSARLSEGVGTLPARRPPRVSV